MLNYDQTGLFIVYASFKHILFRGGTGLISDTDHAGL